MGLIGLLVLVGAMLAVNVAVVAYLFYVLVAYSPLPDPFRWAVVAGPVLVVIWAILSVFGVNLRMSVWRGTAATSPATIAGGGVPPANVAPLGHRPVRLLPRPGPHLTHSPGVAGRARQFLVDLRITLRDCGPRVFLAATR
jgi:hypothetical protein